MPPGGTARAASVHMNTTLAVGGQIVQMIRDFDNLAITSAEKAAQIILTGAAKRKRRVIVGKDAKIISAIQRLFPQKYPIILRKILGSKGDLS